jgi:hypothetical protein
MLFLYNSRYWIKLDNTAVAVNASCTADAFELLIQYYFTFNVSYSMELWLVYAFMEKVLGVRSSVRKCVTLFEFCQYVLNAN